ncbi:hypothetical protein JAO76_15655 [Pontibacter sp. BT310]|uniref:Uncharacterized protein n=1 Tax=Pontibacter populi TaxID=890055 RepID=A0ABS6XG50_9BACT|nr:MULTISPECIES: hypothetical protein [Pontibacter]MBJ6119645.1 hypothetical protein [Pontibacter sp. BT310]MBR0572072.1 hypothetical protein [Microvirga sp. STS03]MBW3366498.1 hypothetical protein [Pontibacter populi]
MAKTLQFFLLVCLSIAAFGCSPLRTLINRKFPPLTTTDQQYAAIERSILELDSLKPHISLHVDNEFIIKRVEQEIKKAAVGAGNEDVTLQSFESKINFDKQGVFVNVDFFVRLPKYKADIKGVISGATAVSTELDSLYLRSALSAVDIKSIDFTKKPGLAKKALAAAIAAILRNYIENINGQLLKKPTVIYAGYNQSYKFSPRELIKNPETEVIADTFTVTRHTKRSAIRLRQDGISVLLEVSKEKPVAHPIPPTSTKPRKLDELAAIFNTYNAKFDTVWLDTFEAIGDSTSISASISKAEIASILNESLSKPIVLRQDFTIPSFSFNERLEAKKNDIDCQQVREPFRYPDFNGASCNWSCEWWNQPCQASKALCIANREAERVIWQAARKAAQLAHETEMLARISSCDLLRNANNFLALGKFKGGVSGNGKAQVNLNAFSFNEDLSEMTLNYSGDLNAKVKSELVLQPLDLGHIFFCHSDFRNRENSDFKVRIPTSNYKIGITSIRKGDELNLIVKPDKIAYKASISPSPLHSLIQNRTFIPKCPIFGTIISAGTVSAMAGNFLGMVTLAPEQELLLMGNASGEYTVDQIQVPIKPIDFKVDEEVLRSQVYMNSKSIQFISVKPPLQLGLSR